MGGPNTSIDVRERAIETRSWNETDPLKVLAEPIPTGPEGTFVMPENSLERLGALGEDIKAAPGLDARKFGTLQEALNAKLLVLQSLNESLGKLESRMASDPATVRLIETIRNNIEKIQANGGEEKLSPEAMKAIRAAGDMIKKVEKSLDGRKMSPWDRLLLIPSLVAAALATTTLNSAK